LNHCSQAALFDTPGLQAPKSDTADQVDYKNLALGSHKRSTRPGLDYLPELVSVLQAELGSDVLLFYDQYGGDRICVSFNPKVKLSMFSV
jgi:hypothetical protein